MWEYKTCDGETPLTLAIKSGHVEHVRTLLAKGVWPNTMNRKGETPLLIGNYFVKGSGDFSLLLELVGS